MSAGFKLKRLTSAVLLVAAVAASGVLHHHEDLSGGFFPPAGDRVVSSHSPLEKAAHWHLGVRVKDDLCLACSVHRSIGMPGAARFDAPILTPLLAAASAAAGSRSFTRIAYGSRGPPALL